VAAALLAVLLELAAAGAITTRARAALPVDPPPGVTAVGTLRIGTPERPRVGIAAPAHGSPHSRFLLVEIERAMPVTARAGDGRVVGVVPAGSRYYGEPTVAWVRRQSPTGEFGLVDVPYAAERAEGWIRLRGLDRSWTRIRVVADLSEHRITVWRGDGVLVRAPAATGAPASPTPVGRYFVTDRVAFPGGGALGTFAFGISGIQTRLPAGWTGGDQLAIHGTDAPASIGHDASAGCLRVSEATLARLPPLLRLGTPVVVRP
jgi:lipoprotein-anchoring transpeptidase ErfK/SrfK